MPVRQLDVGEWGARVGGNLWRTTGDIRDTWQSMVDIGFDKQPGREKYANPGHWNDPDMLEIGNGHMTDTEYTTHMSLWCMLAAPLLAGNDIRDMKPEIAAILMNKEVIAVDQDKLGKQGVAGGEGRRPGSLGEAAGRWRTRGGAVQSGRGGGEGDGEVERCRRSPGRTNCATCGSTRTSARKTGEFSSEVPSHGVVMVKIAK